MKKLTILFIIGFLFVSMLLYSSDSNKVDQERLFQKRNSVNAEHLSSASIPSRDAGDILFQFNPPISPWGVGFDGEFLWLTDAVAADPNIHQYATDGTATGATLNCSSWMGSWVGDMAYTPGYIFAVNVGGDNNIYKIDENTGAVAEIISGAWNTTSARGLAYDPANNEFYIGGWNHTVIYHIDATGATISTIPFASVSGLGWHPMGNNGAGTLWVAENAVANNIYELDPTTGTVLQSFTSPGATYAGAGLEVDNMGNLWAIDQNTNTVYNIDSGVPMGDPGAPAAPSDLVVTPDAGGALEAEIVWVCPSLQINGDPLTELLEMRVYRDGVLIYTDTNPDIGGLGNYTDVPTVSGLYNYSVVGYNSFGEGIPATETVWVGEDVPNVVENLLLVGEYGHGHLTWINPTTGLNGGAFNNAILGYHIERNDGVVFEVAGIVTEYWDTMIPSADNYYYDVTAYNSIGDGGTATSNTALLNSGGTLISEEFNIVPPTGWYIDGLGQTNWSASVSNWAGGTAPELQFYYSPTFTGISRMCSMPVNTEDYDELTLEFKYYVSHFSGPYTLGIATTSDGATWNTAWELIDPSSIPATTETVVITTPDVGSPTFQMCFYFDGYSWNINNWNVDDVMLTGPYVPPNPGFVTGTVTLEGGTGNVENVQVTAAYVTVNPDNTGYYEITILPGTFDITATLDGYFPETVTGVVVEEGLIISGVDFTLEAVVGADDIVTAKTELLNNYPNPFNPETNIAFSTKEAGYTTLEVYNMKGQLVKTLVNEVKESGNYTVTWNGTNNSNRSVSSGVYFYKMVSEGNSGRYISTKKMILLK